MYADPDRYSVPHQWTLSSVTIAEGLLSLEPADTPHCQDVLTSRTRERTDRLDRLNLLSCTFRAGAGGSAQDASWYAGAVAG